MRAASCVSPRRTPGLRSDCRSCPLRRGCLSAKAKRREIERWVHEDVIERHRARMRSAAEVMRRRKALAEHPFGTLKCRAGYRHFLLRGFDKVRGEWSLMALCYNFTRVLSIVGLDRFVVYLAGRAANGAILLIFAAVPIDRRRPPMVRLRVAISWPITAVRPGFTGGS